MIHNNKHSVRTLIIPMRAKNISRFNYKKTAFQGWRLAISRKHINFVKYFGDKKYGGHRQSFMAAVEARNAILHELKQPGIDPAVVFKAAHELLDQETTEEETPNETGE